MDDDRPIIDTTDAGPMLGDLIFRHPIDLAIHAIGFRKRLRIRFNRNERLIEPHRLWKQPDGTYLLEAYQVSGNSAWGDMGDPHFARSPLGGYQAWISFPLEAVDILGLAGGPFTPRSDFHPVSEICLGTMTFGEDWGWGSDIETSRKVIDAYLDRGGNFLDTANVYTKGHSEKIIGDHIGKDPSKRDRVVIATKCSGNMFPGDPNGGGSGRKAMTNAVDESLRRLQTDHIDLLWCHFWDRNTPIDELLRTVDDLVRAGKVRYFGLSDHPAWVCSMAQYESKVNGYTPIIAIQIEYSLRQRTVEGELIPMAQELGMGVTPWSPLAGGILTGKYTRDKKPGGDEAKRDWSKPTDRDYDIIDVLIAVAEEAGATPAQVALKWVQDKPGVTSTIIGARTMPQLEANLDALDVTLTADQTERLDKVSSVEQAFPFEFLEKIKAAIQHGSTINGDSPDPWPMGPEGDSDRH